MDSTGSIVEASMEHGAVRRFRRDAGASLVEYALLVALIAAVCVAAVTFLGGQASSSYSEFGSRVEAS